MNPRQRRGLVLIVLTSIAAVAVFFGIMTYVDDVGSRVGPSVQVLRLTRDVGVYEAITEDMLASVEMPERWVSGATLLADEQDDILGKVASSSFVAGTTVQTGMMVTPPAVEPGYREIAVMVDAETGVAGKVSQATGSTSSRPSAAPTPHRPARACGCPTRRSSTSVSPATSTTRATPARASRARAASP